MATIVVTVSAYNATLTDDTILCDTGSNNVTIVLPDVHPIGKRYVIKHSTGSNLVFITTAVSDTIDGIASFGFTVPKQAVIVHSDGSNWFIL